MPMATGACLCTSREGLEAWSSLAAGADGWLAGAWLTRDACLDELCRSDPLTGSGSKQWRWVGGGVSDS